MTEFTKSVALNHLRDVNLDADMQHLPNAITQGLQMAGAVHVDASESLVFALQLQHLRNQIMDREYPQYKASRLLPMQSEASAGATEFAYIVADRTGAFELISNYADDLPVTDVKGEKKVVDIVEYGGSYHYSIHEQEAAAQAGTPLIARKAVSNRDAAEHRFDKSAWLGDSAAGIFGITNHPNITVESAPNGAGGSPLWANKTAQEIYDDMARPFIQQATDTNGVEMPDTLVLTAARLERARNVFFGDNTGENPITRFREAYPDVMIETVEWMSQAGAGSTQALLAYRRDPMKLGVETPVPYSVLPPQQRNLATVVNARMRTAGAIVYFPLSVTMIEGI